MPFFNAHDYDPATGSQSFPVGTHPVVIKSSAKVATKDQTGGMLVLQLEVISGQYKGFVGPYRLNIWNKSADACDMAYRQLSAICHSVQQYHLQDDTARELFGKPFCIVVTPQKGETDYTQISAVIDINGVPPTRQTAPQHQPAPMQPSMQPQTVAPPAWGAPAAQPAAAPAWGAPQQQPMQQPPVQQPMQPTQPVQQPAWGAPQQPAQVPAASPAAPPAWAQQPATTQPVWGR